MIGPGSSGRTATVLDRNQQAAPWRQAAAATAALAAAWLTLTQSLGAYDVLRERAFDLMLGRLSPPPTQMRVTVVDIDRDSLERSGASWSREDLGALIGAVLAAGPAAVGIDILIDGPDERSPAALARRLADLTDNAEARRLAGQLPDGDARLAQAIHMKPVALALALDPERDSEPPRTTPILPQGWADLSGIWQARGVAGPPRSIAEAAEGLGVLSLAGDSDGRVRRVPLLAIGAEQPVPGLALETVRAAQQAANYVLARGNILRVGGIAVPLPVDASLRLVPPSREAMARRTVLAGDVATPAGRARLAGSVVLIGSSAPAMGGLRLAGAEAEPVPSVQLHANAVAQLLARIHPVRPVAIDLHEGLALVAAALAGLGAALRWPPLRAGLAAVCGALLWLVISGIALRGWQVLLDPIAVPVAVLASFGLSALIVAADTRRREAALRRRFEQHLAPELVSRLAENPGLLKLAGETREASILFTDVEGFTAMTERSDPEALIRMLDRYIDEMSAIIVAHGGMVEKIVGDGFHGLFNAPLDLPGHADKAVACAQAIRDFSMRFVAEPEAAALGFGRTRVGVETGPVIVGDVGGGNRLDYTAYGNAMNTAARLEAANKDLGSAICIGPGTAARMSDTSMLRPLGALDVRGRSETLDVHDIWPAAMTTSEREAWRAALARARHDPDGSVGALAGLAAAHPNDPALLRLIERLGDRRP